MENPQRTPQAHYGGLKRYPIRTTSPLWESGTLAEDKGVLWYPVLGGHRVGHFRDTLSIKHDMK